MKKERLAIRCLSCSLVLLSVLLLLISGRASRADQQSRGQNVRIKVERGQEIDLYDESHALVVGVSDYTNGWRKLDGVKKDVPAVAALLKQLGFHVETLMNPMGDALDKALRTFISKYGLKERNRLLIYFAGHGHTEALPDGRDLGYIVPADAPLPARDPQNFNLRGISMDQIDTFARSIRAKHALFVFDSCFSGSIFESRGENSTPPEIESKTAASVRQFITSGTKKQTVPDESIFRVYFVRAFEQRTGDLNRDGFVTGEELGIYLAGRVASDSRGAQTPRFGKIKDVNLNLGDFVFALPPKPEPPKPTPTPTVKPTPTPTPTVAANISPIPPPARPTSEVMDAVKQALAQMDASLNWGCGIGSCGWSLSDKNSRAVFFDLNQKWQEKAVMGLIAMLSQSATSLDHWKATKLVEYYLRDPNAQKLQDSMLDALDRSLIFESHEYVQSFCVDVIFQSPTSRENKFQRLERHLKTMNDGSGKGTLISRLSQLALPNQREALAAEVTHILATTQSSDVAGAASRVILDFRYRQAIPVLIDALPSASIGRGGYWTVAGHIASLLRYLTPPNLQEREKLAALMTDLMAKTMDSGLIREAATTIKEFGYKKAGPTLTQVLCTSLDGEASNSAADVIKALNYKESLPSLREALQTAPMVVAVHIANVLVAFQDKEGIKALRERIGNDKYMSDYNFVSLAKALYELQGEQSVELLIECFKEGQVSLQTYWIDFFKEKRIVKAREAVQNVRDSTTNDYVKQKANEFLSAVQ